MAVKKIKADLEVAGKILRNFAGTHHLDSAVDIETALELLDQAVYQLDTVSQDLSTQIDGVSDTFQTSEAFDSIRVVLNGLEQNEGADCDFTILDNQHIKLYRSLHPGEKLLVEYRRTL